MNDKQQLIKVTVVQYYEYNPINYREWSGYPNTYTTHANDIFQAAAYDKHFVDEGLVAVTEFLGPRPETDGEHPEYTFEVVEFTQHTNGEVTEVVLKTL